MRALEESILRQDPGLLPRLADRPATERHSAGPRAPSTDAGLAGRARELAAVDDVLAAAARCRGRTVVIRGEPGIGKTRFAEEVLGRARAAGFRCGRGTWDPDGSPPLWGWTRAARAVFGSDQALAATEGGVRDAASESYRLAETLLTAVGSGPPVLLVLDDVHWADADSLRLIRRVAADVADVPVVLVVALRNSPADADGSLADLLGALARLDPLRIDLAGLDEAAIVSCVAVSTGVEISPEIATELVARTDGNPFFVTEVARLLASEGALARPDSSVWRTVPSGVRDVVRQRLAGLPDATSQILAVAAVAGRSFEPAVVEQAAACSPVDVDEALASAIALGLVDEPAPGRYRFTHSLVRDAVYEMLPAPARARTHLLVATALEDAHAGRIPDHAAELAEHYRLAGTAHARSGWTFARRAGESAATRSAHAEALRLFTLAVELQERDPLTSPEERESVRVGRGRALLRLGRPIDAWPEFATAGTSALRRSDPAAAARILLEITHSAVWGWRTRAQVDHAAIDLWNEVLACRDGALTAALRARVEAALAVEHLSRPDGADTSLRLIDSAVARLRTTDAGPQDMGAVLQLAALAIARTDLLHRRAALAEELVERAARAGDECAGARALTQRAGIRAEAGRLEEAHSDLVRAQQLAERHSLPQVLLVSGWGLALLRQVHGDLAGAEEDIDRLERLEHTLATPGVGIGLAQRTTIRWVQGRLGELEPVLRQAAAYQPSELRDLHAMALVEAGRAEEARRMLGPWGEQPAVIRDYLWISLTVLRAWLWLEFADRGLATDDAVADLRRQLTPYADRLASGGLSALFLGSVSHTLARLAAADGDPVAARAHARTALDTHRSLGLEPWTARTEALLARLPD
ncbi:AAA family ATPase [Blastococcus sp. CT_GayMR19]|uniref:ATP-binding protein n=1 Tax=Blastococcus sp. CT_GayMR19 TaxID=2559608 RepID=UPI002476E26B|nr:AAA family ATPase [Blastococcus sp. CT_GayMR19]